MAPPGRCGDSRITELILVKETFMKSSLGADKSIECADPYSLRELSAI